jgi:ribonuclease-3 family protein
MIDARPMEIRNNQMPGSLELAYLGDTIYDLYVRTRLVQRGGKMKQLHKQAVDVVCNHAQSEALKVIEPMLNEAEQDVVRRARNCKQNAPRNADPAEYQRATALEALIGYLYIKGQCERMEQLIETALECAMK